MNGVAIIGGMAVAGVVLCVYIRTSLQYCCCRRRRRVKKEIKKEII